MSSIDIDGPPEAKRFRIDLPTQVVLDAPSVSTACASTTPLAGEASTEGQSPAAPSSASYRSSNGSIVSESPVKEESYNELINDESEGSTVAGSTTNGASCDLLDIFQFRFKRFYYKLFQFDDSISRPSILSKSASPQAQTIPGAVAVAQSPAAQLFAECLNSLQDDWSWHRNPAASIRSGGTNKQTPVWKYFVYNKAENLSRCIVGDCTYMLKGPHTSTLACHLKKHTKEYAEFQKLKTEYSRSKIEMQQQQPKSHENTREFMSRSPDSDMSSIPKPAKVKKDTPRVSSEVNMLLAGKPVPVNHTPAVSSPGALPTMPALMQNMMMGMNPLQMMLAHSLPTSSNGLNALQHAGLSLNPNGQIVPSKKWRLDEKKQKDIQTRLALALATSHIPLDVLQNPAWKELFEFAQPKFNMAFETSQLEIAVSTLNSKLNQSLKALLSASRKVNLLVDVSKLTNDAMKITIGAAIPAGSGNSYETQVVLLAIKNLTNSDTAVDDISKAIEQVISDYSIPSETINRIVCSNVKTLTEEKFKIADKRISSFATLLLGCLFEWLDHSAHVDSVKKDLFTMVFSVIANQVAFQIVTKLNGGKFDFPITEPFPILVESVLNMRECFKLNQIEGFTALTDVHWRKLNGIHGICNMFKPFVGYSSDMTTIDTVIPTIQQLLSGLEKDVHQLGEMGDELKAIIEQKLEFITNPEHPDFDPIYLQATALNPQLAVHLNSDQLAAAKKLIRQEVSKRTKWRENSGKKLAIGVDSILANVIKSGNDGRDALSIYGDLFQTMNKDGDENGDEIVEQYFEEITHTKPVESLFNPIFRTFGNPMQAPLAYWKSCSAKCIDLSDYASELLSIPIFTLTADRVMTYTQNPSPYAQFNSNLISEHSDHLERQLLLRFNKMLVANIL
ncbi:unnamed protein product [Caenorhabditis bovis]|uniref:HAT C-terminal dimerisation domain-containing protein n=1 Tax=Caenorhabditis bovis TaxID=2654633 RepID=A0A8S1ELR0_9PELO|nr:unnamed protein product [Caenorhabditis bovis]